MNPSEILRLGSIRDVAHFQEHLAVLRLTIPCDNELIRGAESPLAQPIVREGIAIGNRFTINPMEGWDGTPDGNPSEHTLRRWQRFGRSGAKLIWGGEAVAVSHEGRANPESALGSFAHASRFGAVEGCAHRRTPTGFGIGRRPFDWAPIDAFGPL